MSAPMSVFQEMRRKQMLCDALLNVCGTQFPAHKLVLCSCSTYFKALFTHWSNHECQNFDISHVSADIMKIILDYAYTGVVQITHENLHRLFRAADHFDISGISQACCQVMLEQLSPSSCIATWRITNNYYYPQLRNQAFLYILKHFEDVVTSSEAFLCLSMDDLCLIIEEDHLNVKEESIVFEAVLRWVGHAPQERNKHLAKLLQKIRLALVHPDYITQCVNNSLLKSNRACKAVVIKTIKLMLDARTRGFNASLFPTYLVRPRLPRAVLMAIGGYSGNNITNSIEAYDNRANRWVGIAHPDETSRAYHGSVFLNGSVYVIGGFDGINHFSTTHKYNLINHTWQEVAPMHSPRAYVSVALLDGLIYAMGGYNGQEIRLNTAEQYSPEANQWTMIASMNNQRSHASSTAYDGKIYICGGFNRHRCLSSAESYNPLTNQWTMITRMSSRRSAVSVIAYFNEIYAVGGFSGFAWLNSVEAYNPNTNRWRPLPSMLNKRGDFGIEVVEDQLYVVGGFNGFTALNCVESYDVRTGVWSKVRDMNIACSALSCTVLYDLPNMADYAAPHSPLEDDPAEE